MRSSLGAPPRWLWAAVALLATARTAQALLIPTNGVASLLIPTPLAPGGKPRHQHRMAATVVACNPRGSVLLLLALALLAAAAAGTKAAKKKRPTASSPGSSSVFGALDKVVP